MDWLSTLRNLVGWGQPTAPAIPVALQAAEPEPPRRRRQVRAAQQGPAHYPPIDEGLEIAPVGQLLAANADMINRLRTHAAIGEAQFTDRYLAPITRVAEHIGSLPATPSGLYGSEGGLLRACTELAFFAFQASDGRIFTGSEGVERRHDLEGRWRYLCFAAGLLYPLGTALDRAVVSDEHGQIWPRMVFPLLEWARESDVGAVFVTWEDSARPLEAPEASITTMMIAPQIVGQANLQWLADGDVAMPRILWEAATGTAGPNALVAQVIRQIWAKLCEREAQRRPQAFGRVLTGTQPGPHLINALRAAVAAGTLDLKEERGLIGDRTGLYLLWPQAAAALIEQAVAGGWTQIPRDPQALALMLAQANIASRDATGTVALIELVRTDGEIVAGLHLPSPAMLVEGFAVAEFAGNNRTLAGVRKDDPLAKAQQPAATPPTATVAADMSPAQVAPPPSAVHPAPQESSIAGSQPQAQHSEGGRPDEPPKEGRRAAASDPAPVVPAQAPSGGRVMEAAAVRYADLIPQEVKDAVRHPGTIEALGKLVAALRRHQEGQGTFQSRRIESGLAIPHAALADLPMRDPTEFVLKLADAGYVYTQPERPGNKVIKVAIPESGKAVSCVVLTNQLLRLLGF